MKALVTVSLLLFAEACVGFHAAKNAAFEYTRIQREITWKEKTQPISVAAEIALQNSGVLIRRGEFAYLTDDRMDEIRHVCKKLGMSVTQGRSLRKQSMVTKTAYSSLKLKSIGRQLSQRLDSGERILDLSWQFDQPPVAIIRSVLECRIRDHYSKDAPENSDIRSIVKAIVDRELSGPHLDDFLSIMEQDELEIARRSDVVSFVKPYDTTEQEEAGRWEHQLYAFLDEEGINYVKEEELRDAGFPSTPDCLILDDCVINAQRVRWVDSKNYFGAGTAKHMLKKVKKQTLKYDALFGESGAIVYRHGFSCSLADALPNTLMLDSGPLQV